MTAEEKYCTSIQIVCFTILQSLAKLTDGFKNYCFITDPLQDFPHNAGPLLESCLPQKFCDAGSQTDIIGQVCLVRDKK